MSVCVCVCVCCLDEWMDPYKYSHILFIFRPRRHLKEFFGEWSVSHHTKKFDLGRLTLSNGIS